MNVTHSVTLPSLLYTLGPILKKKKKKKLTFPVAYLLAAYTDKVSGSGRQSDHIRPWGWQVTPTKYFSDSCQDSLFNYYGRIIYCDSSLKLVYSLIKWRICVEANHRFRHLRRPSAALDNRTTLAMRITSSGLWTRSWCGREVNVAKWRKTIRKCTIPKSQNDSVKKI